MIPELVEWAAEQLPELGPSPRCVCDWLVDAVLGALERRDLPAAWLASCELVLVANGERPPRPRPQGVNPRARVEPQRPAPPPAPSWAPVDQEPLVRYAREVLG